MRSASPIALLAVVAMILLQQEPLSHGASPTPRSPLLTEEDLPKKMAQTLATLFSITIADYFIASRWNRPGTANVVEFRSLLPFKLWGQENLIRVHLPFRTESELGPGLSDARIFDLLIFDTGSGFWGAGVSLNLGINRGPDINPFQIGPALAFMLVPSRAFSVGLLNQNYFGDQVALSTLQPILVYQPIKAWTISLGELPLVYNWKTEQFAVFSLGIQIGVVFRVAEQPIRFFINPQFNTRSSTQLYHWTIASGITLPIAPVTP